MFSWCRYPFIILKVSSCSSSRSLSSGVSHSPGVGRLVSASTSSEDILPLSVLLQVLLSRAHCPRLELSSQSQSSIVLQTLLQLARAAGKLVASVVVIITLSDVKNANFSDVGFMKYFLNVLQENT